MPRADAPAPAAPAAPARAALEWALLPVATLVALIVALAAPLTWFVLRTGELRAEATTHAAELARALRRAVAEEPRLWVYNTPKAAAVIEERAAGRTGLHVRVRAADGRTAYERRTCMPPFLYEEAPIEVGGQAVGAVLVGVSAAPLRRTGLLLLLFFALGGAGVAFLYIVPVRAMRRAEVRLAETAARQRLAARIASAQEDERRRIARELHDSAGQLLTATRLELEAARLRVEAVPDAALRLEQADRAIQLLDRTAESIRTSIEALAPPLLRERGLVSALRSVVADFGMAPCRVDLELPERVVPPLPPAVEACVFRVVQEALTNAVRHARATRATVTLAVAPTEVRVSVADDGPPVGPPAPPGFGLRAMRERVEGLLGTLTVSRGPAGGTTVAAVLPVEAAFDATDDTPPPREAPP